MPVPPECPPATGSTSALPISRPISAPTFSVDLRMSFVPAGPPSRDMPCRSLCQATRVCVSVCRLQDLRALPLFPGGRGFTPGYASGRNQVLKTAESEVSRNAVVGPMRGFSQVLRLCDRRLMQELCAPLLIRTSDPVRAGCRDISAEIAAAPVVLSTLRRSTNASDVQEHLAGRDAPADGCRRSAMRNR